ncbi:tripartite tricarboxylate transporter TctB family protein [Pasteurella langaaensis DSM 22999]|uniref:Tripartite tricarboxylate transporter TctB family protein n=1 Tax=Alitibacter langaaensis DSM 22999 TaxID=1122935 RepID=A0A2U0T7T5_9PAST|nr:tripartite tricarboxylate transporter TctB family protein [Pasteurella langaaensis]PVX39686.1 tripartite tricarboxylate transporter TctB family protein [Pasteurella langaaensis DSM 22999]
MIRLFTPIFLFIFGLIVSVYSYQAYGDFSEYGAAFYPTVIGVILAFFGFIDFIMEIKLKGKYVFQSFDLIQDGKIILLITAVIGFYILTVDYLGFVLTTTLILCFLTLPFMVKNKILIAVLLFILAIGIYLLFAKLLLVGLPGGILFE